MCTHDQKSNLPAPASGDVTDILFECRALIFTIQRGLEREYTDLDNLPPCIWEYVLALEVANRRLDDGIRSVQVILE